MKYLFLLVSVLTICVQPQLLKADALATEAERELEIEMEQNDVGDLRDRTSSAETEAEHQEALMREHQHEFQAVQATKRKLASTAHTRIAQAELRRRRAEVASQKYETEIERLQRQISTLKEELTQSELAAQDAEGMAAEDKSAAIHYRHERKELLKKLHQRKSPAKVRPEDLEAYND